MRKIISFLVIFSCLMISMPVYAESPSDVSEEVNFIIHNGGQVYIDTQKECLCVNYTNNKDEDCAYIITYEHQGLYSELYMSSLNPQNQKLYRIDNLIGIYSVEDVKSQMQNIVKEMS